MAAYSKLLTCSCYELGHSWDPSCLSTFKNVGVHGMITAFKIYAPLYLITALLRRKGKDYFKYKLIPEILQSTTFLGTNAFAFMGAFCLWRRIVGFFFFFNVFVCGIPAFTLPFLLENKDRAALGRFTFLTVSFIPAVCAAYAAINLERPSRRTMLAVYLGNLATETGYLMAVSRGIITPIKHGEVLLFSIVAAIYMYLFRSRGGLSGSMLSGIKSLVGPHELPSSSETGEVRSDKLPSWLPKELTVLIKAARSWIRQGQKHALCNHQYSCFSYGIQGFGKMFGAGYCIQAAVKCIGALSSVFRKPGNLLNALKHKDNFSLGAFLGSFSAIFRVCSCLLRWLRNKDSELHGLVAGFLAGTSMIWYKSSSIALYAASKLVELLYFKGIEAGYLPYIKWGNIVLYTLSTSFVFHAAVFEPHNLRPAYWRFLLRMTDNKFAMMNRRLIDCYGTNASMISPNFWPSYDPRYTNLQPI